MCQATLALGWPGPLEWFVILVIFGLYAWAYANDQGWFD